MQKMLGPILLIILVLGVAAGIYFSASEQFTANSVVTIRGVIGSEKEAFFKDPRVIEQLRKANLDVQVEKAGSRQIAAQLHQGNYDFASPSGIPAAEKIRREYDTIHSYEVFFTPMAIASWQPIAEILVDNGIATKQEGYYLFDMHAFLSLVQAEKRWQDFDNNTHYDVGKSVLINTTDVQTSNSSAMYLALASYVANNNSVVQNEQQAAQVLPHITPLFLKQGFQERSSAVPFNDYLIMGMGKAPMVFIYESQFIYQAATAGGIQPDMVLLYPKPTLYTKHFIVSLSEKGDLLGKLLSNDQSLQNDPILQAVADVLQQLAIEHGFRNSNMASFQKFTKQYNVAIATTLVDVVEPPTYDVLEGMILHIEQLH